MATRFFVTVDGDRVAGPFDSRPEARRIAVERATNEVHLQYRVEAVVAGD